MALFDDMLASHRGAGVVGTLLGGFILIGFVLLSTYAYDSGGSGPSPERLIADQEEEIASLLRIKEVAWERQAGYEKKSRATDILSAAQDRFARDQAELAQLIRLERRSAQAGLNLDEEFANYVRRYRLQVRADAAGESLPYLPLPDGREITDATIIRVTPAGVHVRYADGIIRVPVTELPVEMQERFQFDREEMEQFLRQEREEIGEMEREIDEGLDDLRTEEADKRVANLEKRISLLQNRDKLIRKYMKGLEPNGGGNRAQMDRLRSQLLIGQKEIKARRTELETLRKERQVRGH